MTAPAEWFDVRSLVPWDENPYDHPDRQIDDIVTSIRANGWGDVIVAHRSTARIVSGHARRLAALRLIGESADWRLPDAPEAGMVPVRFLDGEWSDVCEALAIAANETATRAERQDGRLAAILDRLRKGRTEAPETGVRGAELRRLIAQMQRGRPEGQGAEGDAPDPDADGEPDSRAGVVYELGPHRLLCGDSTDGAVPAVMADDRADIVWTDPPYGVAVNDVASVEEARKRRRRLDLKVVENDKLSPEDLHPFLMRSLGASVECLVPGGVIYVAAPPGPLHHVFASVLLELGVWRWTLQWLKDRFVLGRSDYHHRTEPIFYGWKEGAAHYWAGGRDQDNVLEFSRPGASADHPTMKPVALVERCLSNSAPPNAIVLDPFGGSGTSLIAAAGLGMRARLVELSPAYCDVIRRRWTRYADERGIDAGPGALR